MTVLESVKDAAGVSPDDTAFDTELIRYTNSVLIAAKQLGAFAKSYSITTNTNWTDLYNDDDLLSILEDYVCSKVKLKFDPPLASTAIESLKQTIAELEWRLNAEAENMG